MTVWTRISNKNERAKQCKVTKTVSFIWRVVYTVPASHIHALSPHRLTLPFPPDTATATLSPWENNDCPTIVSWISSSKAASKQVRQNRSPVEGRRIWGLRVEQETHNATRDVEEPELTRSSIVRADNELELRQFIVMLTSSSSNFLKSTVWNINGTNALRLLPSA